MTDLRLEDIPYPDRPFTRIERVLEAQLADRDPQGSGEMLLFIVEDSPYFAIPSEDLSGWIVAPLPSATFIPDGKVQVGKTGNTPVASEFREYKFTGMMDVNPANQLAHTVPVWDADDQAHKYTLFDLAMLGDVDMTGRDDGSLLTFDDASDTYQHVHLELADLADIDGTDRDDQKALVYDEASDTHVYRTLGALKRTLLYLNSNQAKTSSGENIVNNWFEAVDELNGFNSGIASSQFVAPEDGVYTATLMFEYIRANTGSVENDFVRIRELDTGKWGEWRIISNSSLVTTSCFVYTCAMTAGQRLEVSLEINNNDVTLQGSTGGNPKKTTWQIVKIA